MFALLAALAASPAQAQDGRDEFGVTGSLAAGWLWFDPNENLLDTWSVVPRLGYSLTRHLTIEGEAGYHQGQTAVFNYRYDSVTPRLNLLVTLAPDWKVRPFVAGGPGFIYKRVSRDPNTWSTEPIEGENIGNYRNPDSDLILNAGPGLMIPLKGAIGLRTDFRWIMNIGTEAHGDVSDVFQDWELTAGFYFRGADRNRDSDLDGILDKVDLCPEDPEDWDEFEDPDGCPDPDNDQDGILDVDDECRDTAEDFDDWEDDDGCPEKDNDFDGLSDLEDECPTDAEDLDGFQDGDGCPEFDNDRDGVRDLNDRCPNHPEDLDGFEDEDGCEDKDNDADAIADLNDACPSIPETYNGFDDADGCPDEVPKEVERFAGVIRGINFEVASDVITADSFWLLDEAATVLMKYPDLSVEVQGHTDSDGSDDYNFDLSDRRAASVVRYLTQRGVDASRLSWMGYGESMPLVPNDTPENKAVNRRVEFKLENTATGEQIGGGATR